MRFYVYIAYYFEKEKGAGGDRVGIGVLSGFVVIVARKVMQTALLRAQDSIKIPIYN
jgi:hypothetical protein